MYGGLNIRKKYIFCRRVLYEPEDVNRRDADEEILKSNLFSVEILVSTRSVIAC